jgi:phosphatidylinositol alpha-1,6-mannosyltransferase
LLTGVKHKKNKIRKVCAEAERIVVNSKFLQHQFEINFEDLAHKTTVMYPCPDAIFLEPAPAAELKKLKSQLALEGKKVIITVARMSEGKGFPHLIRLLPKILEKVPNLVWLIIGDGPKKNEIITSIQKKLSAKCDSIYRPGSIRAATKFYQIADLFVLLTHPDETMQEAWGTSFVEAAASGIPSVAGRSGGVEEAVENMVTGLVVDLYQDQSIVSAIADLLKETEYAKKMGAAGKERVSKEFTWEKQLEKLM